MAEILTLAVTDIAKSVAGVAIARALKIPEKLDFGDSFVLKNASDGALYFAISDGIDAISGKGSKIMNGHIKESLDDILFFSVVNGIADGTGLGNELLSLIQNTLGTTRDTGILIADSTVLSGSRFAADYIDNVPSLPSYLHMIRHPISRFGM
jgi:hypothetical protein